MEIAVPVSIQPLIDAYLRALEPLRTHFYGIYIAGSIALDAFEELESDIDIIALTQGEWSSLELKQLKALRDSFATGYPRLQPWEECRLSFRQHFQFLPAQKE